MSQGGEKKHHKTVNLQIDTYNKLVERGSMTTSFNDVISDLLKNVEQMGASASAVKKEQK